MIDKPKKGSLVLELDSDTVYVVKYILTMAGPTVVVNNGTYDFPILEGNYVLLDTPLLKELL